MTAPSSYSTIEWMMLWGCTTTWIWSTVTPNSHFASITSRPLFTMVDESMVIFLPISQFGCFRASSTWIFLSSSLFFPRKGPPDAVSRILCSAFLCPP